MRKAICTPNEDECECKINRKQLRIQDFPDGGGLQPSGEQQPIIWPNLAQNCMKIKKIGPGASKILQCRSAIGKVSLMPPDISVYSILHVNNINNFIGNSTKSNPGLRRKHIPSAVITIFITILRASLSKYFSNSWLTI